MAQIQEQDPPDIARGATRLGNLTIPPLPKCFAFPNKHQVLSFRRDFLWEFGEQF